MADLLTVVFPSVFILAFSICCILAGLFTFFFGTGRSKNIGGGLILFGIAGFLLIIWFTGLIPGVSAPVEWDFGIILEAIVVIVAALVGIVAALGIFLAAIMKS